jgi:hypothetical protein
MAEMSDSVKQIRASVQKTADELGNSSAFIQQWNSLIDDAIASVTAAQKAAEKYLALDKKAYDLVADSKAAVEGELSTTGEAYNKLSVALSSNGGKGYDILSVLNTYSTMRSGPYCATIVMKNYYAKMGYNIEVMEREKLARERDLETLGQLKI